MPAGESSDAVRNGFVLEREINLIDTGLVLDKGVTDHEPTGGTADSAECRIDQFGALRRQRVNRFAPVGCTCQQRSGGGDRHA